jgi:hypothetical protein
MPDSSWPGKSLLFDASAGVVPRGLRVGRPQLFLTTKGGCNHEENVAVVSLDRCSGLGSRCCACTVCQRTVCADNAGSPEESGYNTQGQ